MKRLSTTIALFLIMALTLISGCSKAEEKTAQKEAVPAAPKEVPVLKVGYVGHDHQSALYVAAELAAKTKADAGIWLEPIEEKKAYSLMNKSGKVATIELNKAGGGSKMPTAMDQGVFEVGFGGIAAIASFNDKGSPMKVISPLQMKGDMLVVKPENPVDSWEAFAKWIKESDTQVKIGYKNPVAVAKLIFEKALDAEGISYTGDDTNKDAKVLMMLLKGEKNLVPGLQNGIVDGYVSNNPWCEIAVEKGIGKIVADLNTLPPGIYKDHPCCVIGANTAAITEKESEIKEFLKLIILATNYLNSEDPAVTKAVAKWTGASEVVEGRSLPTSGFSTKNTEAYSKTVDVWVDAMNEVGKLKGSLKGLSGAEAQAQFVDYSILEKAATELKAAGVEARL